MTMLDIIEKKKLGGELSREEIRFFARAAGKKQRRTISWRHC